MKPVKDGWPAVSGKFQIILALLSERGKYCFQQCGKSRSAEAGISIRALSRVSGSYHPPAAEKSLLRGAFNFSGVSSYDGEK
jgi:hypothetical protein